MEKLPSQAGIVHVYDIDRREYLVTNTRGPGTGKLLLLRHSEGDAMLSAAMRNRRAIVVADAAQNEASLVERYAALGGAKSLIVAPVMQAGRFLGALELLNPLDGQPFTDAEGNALTYIAEQYAEYLSSRGIVTDEQLIASRRVPEQ
jgi:GAF domain-containing protein